MMIKNNAVIKLFRHPLFSIIIFLIFLSCSINLRKRVSDIPDISVKVLNIDELKNIPTNLGLNLVKIHIKSAAPLTRSSTMILMIKDGYTWNFNKTIGPIHIVPGYLDTIIEYRTKPFVSTPNGCDFGLVKVKVLTGELEQEFMQSSEGLAGKSHLVIGEYRYFQHTCFYTDGGMYTYKIESQYNSSQSKITRELVRDESGVLINSGFIVTDTLTTKKLSKNDFLSFLAICREIQQDQYDTNIYDKGTGVLRFDKSNRKLFVTHNSTNKISLDSFLNSVFNQ